MSVLEASRCVRDGRAREEAVVASRAGRSVEKCMMVAVELLKDRTID